MGDPTKNAVNGFPLSRNLTPQLVPLDGCKPLGYRTKKHPPKQIRKLAESLNGFGFVLPILVDSEQRVIAGWGLVLAARKLKLRQVPAIQIDDLPDASLRLLRLALNRITKDSDWDRDALAREFREIIELEPQIEVAASGFELCEVDSLVLGNGTDQEDELPEIDQKQTPTSKPGDTWVLGQHRLRCGDALNADTFATLMGSDKARMVFGDPPYNVPIGGHVSGLGAIQHAEFAMASGELSRDEFTGFLQTSFQHAADFSVNGALHFWCMDWRHVRELLDATTTIYSGLQNLCVWAKSNAGMGSLYRSQHELVFVLKVGKEPHINNVRLGRNGRNRTNVWNYVSQNALNGSRKGKLALHPTVKPVAMIADAIRDCSNRGDIVLDPFGGAGTTLIAAEQTARRARVIEISPQFVDVGVERWQHVSGKAALHAESGKSFSEVRAMRQTDGR